MQENTESEINKKLYLKDWTYSDDDIPVSEFIPSPIHLKKFEEFTIDDKLSILNYTVFKAMFYDDKRLKHSAVLISEFIDISYEEVLKNIILTRNELNGSSAKSRKNITDFVAEINDNLINIEMNNSNTIERNIIYLDKLIDRKNKRGKELVVPEAGFQINLCNFTFKGHDECFEIYEMQSKTKKLLTFCKQNLMIFIPNIWKKYYNGDELTYREKIILVHVAPKVSLAKEIAGGDEYLMEIIEDLKELETNMDLLQAYDHYLDYGEGCRLQGHAEGREEGLEQGERNTLSRLVNSMLKKGKNYNEISDTLELSITEVKKYAEMI